MISTCHIAGEVGSGDGVDVGVKASSSGVEVVCVSVGIKVSVIEASSSGIGVDSVSVGMIISVGEGSKVGVSVSLSKLSVTLSDVESKMAETINSPRAIKTSPSVV